MASPECYLVKKGAYYYRSNACGYTSYKFDAGRYTKEEAEAHASVEPWHMAALHENDVPEDNFVDKEIARLFKRIHLLEMSNSALQSKLSAVKKVSNSRLRRLQASETAIRALMRK